MSISRFTKTITAAAMFVGLSLAQAASYTYTYVGSWSVFNDDAPLWNDSAYSSTQGPLAYTAQEAAALLFGGSASDYVISTAGDSVSSIDFKAWYDVIGYGGSVFAQDYDSKYNGAYYGPVVDGFYTGTLGNINAPASAFIRDNGVFSYNYAFRVTPVPEPETYGLLMAGLGALIVVRRRKYSA